MELVRGLLLKFQNILAALSMPPRPHRHWIQIGIPLPSQHIKRITGFGDWRKLFILVSAFPLTGMNNFMQNIHSLLLSSQVTPSYRITDGTTERLHKVIFCKAQTQASSAYTQCLQNKCVKSVCLAVLSVSTRPYSPSPIIEPGIPDSQYFTVGIAKTFNNAAGAQKV